MNCKHVMVVDDDADIREGLVDALSYEGYDVYCAKNGREALDQLCDLPEEELPGCIFLDLNMPVMDGKTFLSRLEHSDHKLADIPICVASANQELKSLQLEHVAEKIQKPLDLDTIYHIVHHYCGDPIH